MQKAGGSSLRKYSQKVVKSNETSFHRFDSCEGNKYCLELGYNYGNGYQLYYNNSKKGQTQDMMPPGAPSM